MEWCSGCQWLFSVWYSSGQEENAPFFFLAAVRVKGTVRLRMKF